LAPLVDRHNRADDPGPVRGPGSERDSGQAGGGPAPAAGSRDRSPGGARGGIVRNGDGILIVGGGLAAQRCAETLRNRGYERPVRIVCGEALPPYDRPPLSKALLAGQAPD